MCPTAKDSNLTSKALNRSLHKYYAHVRSPKNPSRNSQKMFGLKVTKMLKSYENSKYFLFLF